MSSLKGKPFTEEHKRKISESLKGHSGMVFSKETLEKMSKDRSGEKNVMYGKTHTAETKTKISAAHKGRISTFKGHHHTEENKNRQSEILKGRFSGENSFNWKGGRVVAVHTLRTTRDYRIWRRAVLERDCHTCVSCGCKEGTLHAHHIISISDDISKALDISNGETLCVECHQREHPFNLYRGRTP